MKDNIFLYRNKTPVAQTITHINSELPCIEDNQKFEL